MPACLSRKAMMHERYCTATLDARLTREPTHESPGVGWTGIEVEG